MTISHNHYIIKSITKIDDKTKFHCTQQVNETESDSPISKNISTYNIINIIIIIYKNKYQ